MKKRRVRSNAAFAAENFRPERLWNGRDDYYDKKIFLHDPFQSIDEEGVGKLVDISVRKSRTVRRDIELGICGEHGGDPKSIDFCHRVGLNYVSCSPYRVPVARLAAAQAAIRNSIDVI